MTAREDREMFFRRYRSFEPTPIIDKVAENCFLFYDNWYKKLRIKSKFWHFEFYWLGSKLPIGDKRRIEINWSKFECDIHTDYKHLKNEVIHQLKKHIGNHSFKLESFKYRG